MPFQRSSVPVRVPRVPFPRRWQCSVETFARGDQSLIEQHSCCPDQTLSLSHGDMYRASASPDPTVDLGLTRYRAPSRLAAQIGRRPTSRVGSTSYVAVDAN